GAHQHRLAGTVEATQEGIAPDQRNARPAGVHVFGKARVDRAGEGQPAPLQPAPGGPAERALGRQVHAVRAEVADRRADPPQVPGQGNLRVARTGHVVEVLRRQHLDQMPQSTQFPHQRLQAGDHAVDLRRPGIADDENPHAACPTVATSVACVWSSASRYSWMLPSRCSISAEQDSTQSPQFMYSTAPTRRISAWWMCPQTTPSKPRLTHSWAMASSKSLMKFTAVLTLCLR